MIAVLGAALVPVVSVADARSGDGAIGKYTGFRVRRRGAPFRRDLCIAPGGFTVTRCPGR